jgi:hypothetical protein
MKAARNYLALAVLGCLALRLLVVLIAPLVPLLIGLLIAATFVTLVIGNRSRRL